MSIRQLIKNYDSNARYVIFKDEAVIVFDYLGKEYVFYLKKPSVEELRETFIQFERVTNIRFVGPQKIENQILSIVLLWPNFSRRINTDSKITNLFFISNTGKIKIEKNVNEKQTDKYFKKRKVLIIDDSLTIQKILKNIINDSKKLVVMNTASSPEEAKTIIEEEEPDLITLDIHMGKVSGVDFLRSYLGDKKIPTIIISSVSISEGPLVLEALSYGAQTYIQKPTFENLEECRIEILSKLEALVSKTIEEETEDTKNISLKFNKINRGLIAIGSSTGGTQALERIFKGLPDEIPPILVVQHIPADFSRALADRLNNLCRFLVKEAVHGDIVSPNTIYIAPGGMQMRVVESEPHYEIQILDEDPVNRFKPSVDYLFNSLVNIGERHLMGVLLTGMGRDGAKGLLAIKESGGHTIAQDEASSVVFGMPKEAIKIGAADKVVSLSNMAKEIVMDFNMLQKGK